MSEPSEVTAPATPSAAAKRGSLLNGVRQLSYAWIGAFDVVREDVGDFYTRCAARGEQIVSGGPLTIRPRAIHRVSRSEVDHPGEAEPDRAAPATKTWITALFVFYSDVMVRPKARDLATKTEINALIEQVDALSREVDALTDRRSP
jgi:hypothetical protein